MQVKELKQYIKWLIDNDFDEYNENTNKLYGRPAIPLIDWKNNIIYCNDDNIKIISSIDCDDIKYYNIELNQSGSYVIYEEYINEWRVINRKQKLERICNHIDI